MPFSFLGFVRRHRLIASPPSVNKEDGVLRFGLLGASKIAITAVINSAKSHSEVIVSAVASRDLEKGKQYARKHSIERVYGGENAYQELVNDPEIDVIYNALPNSLHYEWTVKSPLAGKHVLLEKPCADTAAEARILFDLASKKNLTLLEGYRYTFYPAIHRVKAIVESGELGKIQSVHTEFCVAKGIIPAGDIREQYPLGGGATMDLGVYALDSIRFITSSNPTSVDSASAVPHTRDAQTDRRMTVLYTFPGDITTDSVVDMQEPGCGPFGLFPHFPPVKNAIVIKLEGGEVHHYGTFLPHLYHSITVTPKKGNARVEKAYTFKDGPGEFWWTSYRYQLEAFVNRVRNRPTHAWVRPEDSIAQMEWIEKIYQRSGLPIRPASTFQDREEL